MHIVGNEELLGALVKTEPQGHVDGISIKQGKGCNFPLKRVQDQ